MSLNQLYRFIKNECALYKNAYNPTAEWRADKLCGIYKAAYEYVRAGGKKDIDTIIADATQR